MSKTDYGIIKANPEQAEFISDLAFRSKAYWGYPDEFMQACRQELTYSQQEIKNNHCYCLVENRKVLGFYILKQRSTTVCELDALFIEPTAIKRGYGSSLVKHAREISKRLGGKKIIIQGDPNTTNFYLSVGAIQTGIKESESIQGRYLPMFEIDLKS